MMKLAALAVGYEIDTDGDRTDIRENTGAPVVWRPLENDGDALRLLVDTGCQEYLGEFIRDYTTKEERTQDPAGSTRKAIFLAAVDIGERILKESTGGA